MMSNHSGDPSMETLPVTLGFDTSAQWRRAIYATVAVSRIRRSHTRTRSTRQQGLGEPEQPDPESLNQNGSSRQNGEIHSRPSHNEEANQVDSDALDRRLEDENPEVKVLKQIRDELVKQLDAYGLVLVLLAGITFVAILQPPGSFDNGKLQESVLVSLFMLLATLSFFIACTGLGAVMVGCTELFRPFFYPKLANYTAVSELRQPPLDSPPAETPARAGFRNRLLGCWEIGLNSVTSDNIQLLAKLCLENVYRIRRIRIYLGMALVLCIAAYICGALAVMVTNDLQRYMLVGAMGGGSVIVLFEIYKTLSSPMAKRGDASMERELNRYTMGREPTHPV